MHGFSSGSTCLVNAEVDSMGGFVDGGVGIGSKPSPRQVAVEKAHTELRLEYNVREERRRELEFLEKGGNPLDFKFGHAASVSIQSTSCTNQHLEQFLTSEAKASFALTASPHGDSVESSGRLGVTTACEPNSADNFDGENELREGERKSTRHVRGSITRSEHSSQLDGTQNVKDLGNSPIFHPKKGQAYRRRNQSRPSRDGPRSSSIDVASSVGHGPSLSNRHVILSKPIMAENQSEMELNGTHTLHLSTTSSANEFLEGKRNTSTSKDKHKEPQHQGVKAEEVPIATTTFKPDKLAGQENFVPVDDGCPPRSGAEQNKNIPITVELNESNKLNVNGKCNPNEGLLGNIGKTTKGIDSESSCSQTSISVDGNGNIESETCLNLRNVDSDGVPKEHKLSLGEKSVVKDEKMLNENHACSAMERSYCNEDDKNSISHQGNGFAEKDQQESDRGRFTTVDEASCQADFSCQEENDHNQKKSDGQAGPHGDSIPKMERNSPMRLNSLVDPSCDEPNGTDPSASPAPSQPQTFVDDQPKVVDKEEEDRILEEARMIEAKRKRIAELSGGLLTREYRQKSHWDFVVEEMAWLANDFAQEHLWKVTAAAQICHRVAFASRMRLEERNEHCKQKSIAQSLANAVMEFWSCAGLIVENESSSESEKCLRDAKVDQIKVAAHRFEGLEKDNDLEQELQSQGKKRDLAVRRYAVRFLQLNCSLMPFVKLEVSGSPTASDIDVPEISWQDPFIEETLFYVVPAGAMETYRTSIESCLTEFQRTANRMQEELDASMYDAPAEYGYQENDYGEDEGENAYYLPVAFGTGKPPKKKQKNMKFYVARSYDAGGDFGYGQCMENKNGTLQSVLIGKRPSNSLHVGLIPTKKMRTACRQRVGGFFNAGSAVFAPTPNRPDASSGDTNSFQDDQSTLHGECVVLRNSEADSATNFDKQSPFDSTGILAKPKKKKKKIKHQGAVYDQRWWLDSAMQNEQKDNVRKRLDGYQLELNGNSLFAQHAKKLKLMKQSLDNSFDNTVPMSGSVASPVASQTSNMSNQSKIIKLIGGRDRGRKAKAFKVLAGQPGSGSPWTLFEDQALVVLVHDMGPNWELVSDAMNSTLQFKCIFRKPRECKERHKILMDRTAGDGADSAEDSGSSQPYPSTLPGIPKGSARQLFQRLQGPMEEDTIKCHFEKIILIEQQLHYHKKQNDTQDLKQIVPVHGSHVVAISQVIPNNVNGGILTPLEFCDAAASNQDLLPLGYQGTHAGGLPLSNQSTVSPMHSPGGVNSPLQVPSSMGLGNNLATPSSQFNSPRYPVPRSVSLPIEEQQRLLQYSQMLHGRNIQPSNLTAGAPPGTDCGVRVLPGVNGVGMMSGMNRNMLMPRPGLQGFTSSPILNSGSVLVSSMGAMPNMNMPSGADSSSQGNSMFRPRDALHVVRRGQSSEHQRHMMMPEMQMQGSQSNSQEDEVPSFTGVSSGFINQTSSSVQTYSGHHQQQHPMQQQQQQHSHVLNDSRHPHLPGSNHSATPEQQALLRLARDRQIQQRLLQRQQQQQQMLSSSSLMTHVQTPPQLPVSSSLQSSSELQSQATSATSQPVALPPLSPSSPMMHVSSQRQQQQKHQMQPRGLGQSGQSGASGMMTGKHHQRQAQQLQQQYQQSGRQHPQQRQQSQPQQQGKLLKGIGRNNMLIHANLPMDPSHLNGLSASPGAQIPEKGEQAAHLMQGQGLYSVPGLNAMQPSKSLATPQNSSSSQPQKQHANPTPTIPNQIQQILSDQDSNNQGMIPEVPSASAAPTSNQGIQSTVMPSINRQHLQGHSQPLLKTANRSHPVHKGQIQQSHVVNSDSSTKLRADHIPSEQQFASNAPSAIALSSSANTAVMMAPESVCDSTMPSSPSSSGPVSSPGITSSSGNEPLSSVNQGPLRGQLSGKLVPQGNSVGAQWQQQQSQLQPPHPHQSLLPQKQSQHLLQQLELSTQRVPQ